MKSLLKHISLYKDGSVEDNTAVATTMVNGIPPTITRYGDCDVFIFCLNSRRRHMPAYQIAGLLGYYVPERAGHTNWMGMHPSTLHYSKPNMAGYFMPKQWFGYVEGVSLGEQFEEFILSAYVGGCIGERLHEKHQGTTSNTIKASQEWTRVQSSTRRGLALMASSLLVITIGESELLGENMMVDIASLVDLESAMGRFNIDAIEKTAPLDVKSNSKVDLRCFEKSVRGWGGLMVPFYGAKDLLDMFRVSSQITLGYENDCLLASPPNEDFLQIQTWEFWRQLYLYTNSWEYDMEGQDPIITGLRSRVPRYIIENLRRNHKEPPRESPVDLLQRSLKSRKRNVGVTYRVNGKKKGEKEYISGLPEITLSGCFISYMRWRSSIDHIFGTSTLEYTVVPPSPIPWEVMNPIAMASLIPVINNLEAVGLIQETLPYYKRILSICSNEMMADLGLTGIVPSSHDKDKSLDVLGSTGCSLSTQARSFYDMRVGVFANCELLTYPWVGKRVEQILDVLGVQPDEELAELLASAKAGDLLNKRQPLYLFYRELAKKGLY